MRRFYSVTVREVGTTVQVPYRNVALVPIDDTGRVDRGRHKTLPLFVHSWKAWTGSKQRARCSMIGPRLSPP